jgi:lipoprotein signal peptidase
MLTACIAALTLGGCDAARRFLDRSSRHETDYLGGRVRLKALWNDGAGFGLPVSRDAVTAASMVLLAGLWQKRKQHPVSTGLLLGGGLSNLRERLKQGKVYDYVQFPKAPGKLKNYVFNAADFAIILGSVGLVLRKRK